MYKSKLHFLIEEAYKYDLVLMGDNFLGFKFVGYASIKNYYNAQLVSMTRRNQLNENWLKARGINFLPHNSTQWNMT